LNGWNVLNLLNVLERIDLGEFVLVDTRIHQSHTRTQNLLAAPRAFDSRLLFNLEEQRPKGIVNIPPMTDKIYFDTGFTVV
jgi:hypothetical protein